MIKKFTVLIVCTLVAFVGKPGIAAGYRIRELPLLMVGGGNRAHAINDAGQVAGSASYAQGKENTVLWVKEHAVVWDPEGVIKDLGCLPGGNMSWANDINDAGQIVGWSNATSTEQLRDKHAVLWEKDGSVKEILAIPDDESSEALAINNRGQVVGRRSRGAFLWSAETGMVDLKPQGSAVAINDSGQIAGCRYNADMKPRPVMWDSNGNGKDLTPVLGDGDTSISAINESGDIVGTRTKDGRNAAFLWSPSGGLTELGTLPDPPVFVGSISPPPLPGTQAASVNDQGQVVGWYYGKQTKCWGFYWSSSVGMLSFGPPPRKEQPKTEDMGGDGTKRTLKFSQCVLFVGRYDYGSDWSALRDINNKGVIIGSVNGRASVWTPE